ncbi:chaperone modulator CbpM [Streptosporangium sp. KLBMP 9127]|nr:chaperone modulator CbpM [Streptosporangium sp. KLBMP 9127]
MTYALVPVRLLDLDSFAHATGLHPEVVRRLVALGVLEAVRDSRGEWCLPLSQVAVAARVRRLRAGLSLNYASLGLVIDLLDRIAELESALRAVHEAGGERKWIRTG